MPKIDFKALREIPILDVAHFLGLELKKSGDQYRGSCPICRYGSDRAFTITPGVQRFWCFAPKHRAGGDGLELAVRVLKLSHHEAAKHLQDHFR